MIKKLSQETANNAPEIDDSASEIDDSALKSMYDKIKQNSGMILTIKDGLMEAIDNAENLKEKISGIYDDPEVTSKMFSKIAEKFNSEKEKITSKIDAMTEGYEDSKYIFDSYESILSSIDAITEEYNSLPPESRLYIEQTVGEDSFKSLKESFENIKLPTQMTFEVNGSRYSTSRASDGITSDKRYFVLSSSEDLPYEKFEGEVGTPAGSNTAAAPSRYMIPMSNVTKLEAHFVAPYYTKMISLSWIPERKVFFKGQDNFEGSNFNAIFMPGSDTGVVIKKTSAYNANSIIKSASGDTPDPAYNSKLLIANIAFFKNFNAKFKSFDINSLDYSDKLAIAGALLPGKETIEPIIKTIDALSLTVPIATDLKGILNKLVQEVGGLKPLDVDSLKTRITKYLTSSQGVTLLILLCLAILGKSYVDVKNDVFSLFGPSAVGTATSIMFITRVFPEVIMSLFGRVLNEFATAVRGLFSGIKSGVSTALSVSPAVKGLFDFVTNPIVAIIGVSLILPIVRAIHDGAGWEVFSSAIFSGEMSYYDVFGFTGEYYSLVDAILTVFSGTVTTALVSQSSGIISIAISSIKDYVISKIPEFTVRAASYYSKRISAKDRAAFDKLIGDVEGEISDDGNISAEDFNRGIEPVVKSLIKVAMELDSGFNPTKDMPPGPKSIFEQVHNIRSSSLKTNGFEKISKLIEFLNKNHPNEAKYLQNVVKYT